jgi:SAM-dependent methyltransferase
LCELLRAHPGLEVDCVDASERMLQLARKWIERELPDRADRIHFLRRDITSWSPPENRYDLVVTHFFLDCFPEDRVADIVTRLSRTVTADATWLLADFCTPAGGFARVGAGLWLAVMYRFFQSTAGIEADELLDAAPFLEAEGFSMARQHLSRRGMLKSELWRRNW